MTNGCNNVNDNPLVGGILSVKRMLLIEKKNTARAKLALGLFRHEKNI